MKGLVYKDLMTELHELKRMWLFLLIFLIGFPFIMHTAGDDPSDIYGMPMTMCTVMGMAMINTSFGYDERSGWMQYALTNPLSRIQYYHAKFLTHAVNVLFGSVAGLVIGTLLAGVTGQLTLTGFGVMLAGSALTAVALFLVGILFVPLMLKFGVQKGALIMMLVFLAIGGSCAALIMALLTLNDSPLFVAPIVAVLALGVFITMYLLGRKWILEKEF